MNRTKVKDEVEEVDVCDVADDVAVGYDLGSVVVLSVGCVVLAACDYLYNGASVVAAAVDVVSAHNVAVAVVFGNFGDGYD